MIIIIPIGGVGARFQLEGYTRPKPLLNVLGVPMITHVLDNLKTTQQDTIYIIYNGDLDKFMFGDLIRHKYPKIKLIKIDNRTRGASETVAMCLRQLSDSELSQKIMTVDCDTFYVTDVVSKFREQTDNAVFCFVDTMNDPIYSYVDFGSGKIINNIKEKEKISNYANTGCYCFASGHDLLKYCEFSIMKFEKAEHPQKELYMSGVIGNMIADQHIFKAIIISEDDFHCLGTPLQVKVFCTEHVKKFTRPLRFCFDLDGTLVTFPRIKDDYLSVEPIMTNIRTCQHLKRHGHTIIIYTARRMRTHHGNVGKCIADIGRLTLDTIEKFGIPCDEIHFGKPYADFYIDDLAIDARFDLERELGIYKTEVEERSFNKLISKSDNIITKHGEPNTIKGEIYWYNNIPKDVKEYFPIMFKNNIIDGWYDVEKISGVNMSWLYTSEGLNETMLLKFLKAIEEIHTSKTCHEEIDIYANYGDKIVKRYRSYDYSGFPNSEKVFNGLVEYFRKYVEQGFGQLSVVHGDPVFSNCMINDKGLFKFIDMRGLQGEKETIFGDKWYDYGKIYQSLIGYDEILLDRTVRIDYRDKMVATFVKFVEDKYGKDIMQQIKMITNSLLFTLIPLHDNDKCAKYFKLISM